MCIRDRGREGRLGSPRFFDKFTPMTTVRQRSAALKWTVRPGRWPWRYCVCTCRNATSTSASCRLPLRPVTTRPSLTTEPPSPPQTHVLASSSYSVWPQVSKRAALVCVRIFGPPRSSEIDDFRAIWKGLCDFLLVINSNLSSIFHRFWDTTTYRL